MSGLDENPYAEHVIGLYQRHARAWAADRGSRLRERAWLDKFRALLPAAATILDLGCGSADPIARYLIEQDGDLTGIDSAPQMIDLCQAKFPLGDWQVADMRSLSLGRAFNGILAWDSFFHLSHAAQRHMFPIFRAHAAPRAALMFTSGTSCGVAMGSYAGEPLYHASLDAADYRALLAENEFDVVAHVIEDAECGGRTVWLAQRR